MSIKKHFILYLFYLWNPTDPPCLADRTGIALSSHLEGLAPPGGLLSLALQPRDPPALSPGSKCLPLTSIPVTEAVRLWDLFNQSCNQLKYSPFSLQFSLLRKTASSKSAEQVLFNSSWPGVSRASVLLHFLFWSPDDFFLYYKYVFLLSQSERMPTF